MTKTYLEFECGIKDTGDRFMFLAVRKKLITKPIFRWPNSGFPGLSNTEREALEAGDVWWDAELFSGDPDWTMLSDVAPPKLSEEEQAFLEGPVEELCSRLDDWRINWEFADLPPEIWDLIRENYFFGMIIPKKYGGLGFSAYAHSEVVRKISTRSVVAAVTVMVPNSLGPGELLLQFGTDEQREYWLPRLADGREIPCSARQARRRDRMLRRCRIAGRSAVASMRAKKRSVSSSTGTNVYEWIYGKPEKNDDVAEPDSALSDRLILPMLNAGAACLRDGVVDDEDTLDAAMVFATGFAPFRGGPLHYAKDRGFQYVADTLDKLADMHGERFSANPYWQERSIDQ